MGKWNVSRLYKKIQQKIIWIDFENPPIGLNTRLQYTQMYDKIQNFQKSWTLIK
jgi:hypothetical protein